MTDLDWRPLLLAAGATALAVAYVGWAGGLAGSSSTAWPVTVLLAVLVVFVLAVATAYWIGVNAAVDEPT